jgi:hypothetical protein
MKYFNAGTTVLNEYIKAARLNMTAPELAKKVSSAPDTFTNNIGLNYAIGLEYNLARLQDSMKDLADVAAGRFPDSSMFFEAIRREVESRQSWDILKFGVVEGLKDLGGEIELAAKNTAGLIQIFNRALPFVVLVFAAGYIAKQYKKVAK